MSYDRQRDQMYYQQHGERDPRDTYRDQRYGYEQQRMENHRHNHGIQREQYGRYERGPERPYMDHPFSSMQAKPDAQGGRYKSHDSHKGYIVLMRFRQKDLGDVRAGFDLNVSSLKAHGGSIVGYAEAKDILVNEEDTFSVTRHAWNSYYNAACVLVFNDLQSAVSFFNSARPIRQPDWPSYDNYQVVAVPLNWASTNNMAFDPSVLRNETVTLLWTEYPQFDDRHTNPYAFHENFTDVVSDCIRRVGGSPFIAATKYKAGPPPDPIEGRLAPRLARAIRTSWVDPESVITISYFPSIDHYRDYFRNEDVRRAIYYQNSVTKATSVAITLHKIKST